MPKLGWNKGNVFSIEFWIYSGWAQYFDLFGLTFMDDYAMLFYEQLYLSCHHKMTFVLFCYF